MLDKDLHVHTNYCDGKNSPEEMIQAAISLGYEKIGLVCHSFVDFDDCCASIDGQEKFVKEVDRLKKKYSDKIDVLAGVEQDYFSEIDNSMFDYVIGSVHYLNINNNYLSIDIDEKSFIDIVNSYFDGDPLLLCEKYYSLMSKIKEKTNCDIIGHFDLVSKFNQNDKIFDTSSSRYVNAWKSSLDIIGCYDSVFEINYGAVLRGYKTLPYPSQNIIEYISKHRGNLVKSSDAHSVQALKNFAALNLSI